MDLKSQPLEEAARRAADLFLQIYRGLEERPVVPTTGREALREAFNGTLTDEGVGLIRALDDFQRLVLPASMGTPHPLYLGLINSSPLPGAALADLLISSLNNNGGAFHQSPAMTACEQEVVRAFTSLFQLPPETDGMFLPGGTLANLQGILLARTHASDEGAKGHLRLYTSEAAHFSVSRSATVVGIAPAAIVAIPTEGRGEMSVRALADRIQQDRREGQRPFAVVATAGTTGTGAVDPLAELAQLCRQEGLWLHVDACYGGALMLVPALRPRLAGIEQADSIAIDPHKWFFIPVTAGLLLNRHPKVAQRAFEATASSYIPGDGAVDAWRRGIPTTRRSSGFAVWMGLRAHGWRTIREAVERNIALMRLLEELLAKQGFRILPQGELSIACARWEPPGFDGERVDRLQEAISREVIGSGQAWFSTVRHQARTWLRFNLVNLYTREHHIHKLASIVLGTAKRLTNSVVP
jgi:glutamate/tyrosine decarboxylase-like PLP-dependent enzyme